MNEILADLANVVISIVEGGGYAGIFVLMMLEGSFVPIPSEVVLPFSGYLVSEGKFSLWVIAFIGGAANVVGTFITYIIARRYGLKFVLRYGKYFLVSRSDIERIERLFDKYGTATVLITRLIPGVRGFVPIAAGLSKMPLRSFLPLVFVGSFFYSLVLTYIGVLLGEHWEQVHSYVGFFDWILVFLFFTIIIFLTARFIREYRKDNARDIKNAKK